MTFGSEGIRGKVMIFFNCDKFWQQNIKAKKPFDCLQ